MADEFSHRIPEDVADWHPSRGLEPDFGMTDEELEAAIQILEVIHTQVPTRRDSPRPFYQERVSSPIDHPVFSDLEITQSPLDIFLSQHAENRMIDHLDSAVPLEAIGLVLGRIGIDQIDDRDRTYVELKETIPMRPIDGTSRTTATSAAITVTGWIRAWEILEYLRTEHPETYEDVHIIGWYHQHPIGTSLSQMDVFLHNTVFDEPHQITFVRNSTDGATGVFYRNIDIKNGKRLIPTNHFRQSSGYYYEEKKPVAYDILEYLEKVQQEADLSKPIDFSELEKIIRDQLIPWMTAKETEHELKEIINVAGIISFEELLQNEEIIITSEDAVNFNEDQLDLGYIGSAIDTIVIMLDQLGEEEENIVELIQIEEEPQRLKSLLNKLQNSVGNALIRLGKKIKKD
ncbi:MAG: hypothetical protein UV73_C0022G0011 [Candidatus Gottesmanbacteria bacterium GW2011_GWA2_43_14]|uniref:JAB1/MPN/MOV34 metalloenzyme domain-containing protein n=1 Tax=Candidatus Gottesmanbacteria bacterium GW2011_GWA2_43_14 TaxID=1618443 RepID=A0A0G1DBX3_9BACT|nr:MAG: hypothetical protein UV73_C0022G0011 [Candidatus Gottesmanbacteria bacterium GW2011_GWA2_43_14]